MPAKKNRSQSPSLPRQDGNDSKTQSAHRSAPTAALFKAVVDLKLHTEYERIPDGSPKENEDLAADMKEHGFDLKWPLFINSQNVIIDGRRRLIGAKAAGIAKVPCIVVEERDEIEAMYRYAIGRRNLSDFGKFEVAKGLRDYLAAKAKKNQLHQNSDGASNKPVNTNREMGKALGFSHDTVGRCAFLDQHATAQEKEALRSRAKSINKVYEEVKERVVQKKYAKRAKEAAKARPPYEPDDGKEWENRILCGNNADVLPRVPDGVVTLYLTSIPYPTPLVIYDVYKYKDYDTWLEEQKKWMTEAVRTLRHGGRIVINLDNTSEREHLADSSENGSGKRDAIFDIKRVAYDLGLLYFDEITWYKQKTVGSKQRVAWGTFSDPTCPSIRHNSEQVLIFAKGTRVLDGDEKLCDLMPDEFKRGTISTYNYDAKNSRAAELTETIETPDGDIPNFWYINPVTSSERKTGCPCPFPPKLCELLIALLTRRGDLVVDPCNGSGTTTMVARQKGRRWLGIDLSEDYCRQALERLVSEPQTPKNSKKKK